MAVKLVRANSNTPNVQNYDDARLFRYACGGYDGVVKNFENECGYEINGSTFNVKSGEIVIDGWQADIDGSGSSITVDSIAGKQYYVLYAEIDLQVSVDQKASIKASYNTAYYPTITRGDDLTTNSSGVARIELYRFEASNGVISNVVKQFKTIDYGWVKNSEKATQLTGTIDSEVLATTQPNTDNSTKVATTAFVKTAIGDALNIIEGNIMFGSSVAGKVYRQANFVYGKVEGWNRVGEYQTFTIPQQFRPKTNISCGYDISYTSALIGGTSPVCIVKTNGNIEFSGPSFGNITLRGIYFGYEITE